MRPAAWWTLHSVRDEHARNAMPGKSDAMSVRVHLRAPPVYEMPGRASRDLDRKDVSGDHQRILMGLL